MMAESIVDRRCHFNDVSRKIPTPIPRSYVLEFYSANPNIGNYTPVLGIQNMLGFEPDVWDVHRRPIDFEHINKTYKAVIIGGAGLFHKVFEPFWVDLAKSCKLPVVIWGVGGCFVDHEPESVVSRPVVCEVAARSDLINVRDVVTAEYYGLHQADISPCPTIAWLENWTRRRNAARILFASHTDLVPKENEREIIRTIKSTGEMFWYTDNIQRPTCGLIDLIQRWYCKSRLVVSTRLHGAIIAYGLKIPYVVIAWDEKLRAFQREWGNGYIAKNPHDLKQFISSSGSLNDELHPLPIQNVRQFGARVRSWLDAQSVTHSLPH